MSVHNHGLDYCPERRLASGQLRGACLADDGLPALTSDVYAENLRVLKHEAETPMLGHDGYCCVRARLGVSWLRPGALQFLTEEEAALASAEAAWEQAVTAELVASTLGGREPNPARAILNALADALAKPLLWMMTRRR